MQYFYIKEKLTINQILDLPANMHDHIKVLRIKENDEVVLFNGDNLNYIAKLKQIGKNKTEAIIINILLNKNYNPNKLHLSISLIAMDNLELVIKSSIELGVTNIQIFNSSRTQRINKERLNNKFERWQQIIISACAQTKISKIPLLERNIFEFSEIISIDFTNKIILSPWHESVYTPSNTNTSEDNMLIIGPEGGFTDAEIKLAVENKCKCLKLGNRILRAETAAISAINYIQSTSGEYTR